MENTHDLTNEELLFIYYSNKKVVDRFNKAFEHKALENVIPTPFGLIMTRRKLSDSDIAELQNDTEYVICKGIVNKLGIIVEVIESIGDDYSYIKKIFEPKIDLSTKDLFEDDSEG